MCWCLGGASRGSHACTLDVAIITILDCLQLLAHMHASNSIAIIAAKLQLWVLSFSLKGIFLWGSKSSLDSWLLTMAVGLTELKSCQTATITRQNAEWACALHDRRGLYSPVVCAAVCRSLDFTWVAIRFVIQIELSSWKVVYIGQVDLSWMLNRWQQPWMWANHAITVEWSLVSKFFFNIFLRGLHVILVEQVSALKSLALWRNVTWKYRRTDTHDDYRMLLGLRPLRHN